MKLFEQYVDYIRLQVVHAREALAMGTTQLD